MAWIGGALQISEQLFKLIMLISLIVVLARIYLVRETAFRLNLGRVQVILLSLALGALLGFLAGVIGIGGGIFLVPLILVLGLGVSAYFWFRKEERARSKEQGQSIRSRIDDDRHGRGWISRIGWRNCRSHGRKFARFPLKPSRISSSPKR